MSGLLGLPTRAPRALDGRVVLVSGAHGGLGSAASLACAEAGATVVLDLNKDSFNSIFSQRLI